MNDALAILLAQAVAFLIALVLCVLSFATPASSKGKHKIYRKFGFVVLAPATALLFPMYLLASLSTELKDYVVLYGLPLLTFVFCSTTILRSKK